MDTRNICLGVANTSGHNPKRSLNGTSGGSICFSGLCGSVKVKEEWWGVVVYLGIFLVLFRGGTKRV